MSKEKMRSVTREELIARAQAKESDKSKYFEYECESLGVMMVKKLPLGRICDIMDMTDESSAKGALEMYKQLIYVSVPILQDKEVQAAFGCAEPSEIVPKVLDDNLGEITKLAGFILTKYGIDTLGDDIKN